MTDDAASSGDNAGPMLVPPSGAVSREIPIINKRGLHARASAKFVQMVERFDAEVSVTRGGETVGGTSIMGLMMLSAGTGHHHHRLRDRRRGAKPRRGDHRTGRQQVQRRRRSEQRLRETVQRRIRALTTADFPPAARSRSSSVIDGPGWPWKKRRV